MTGYNRDRLSWIRWIDKMTPEHIASVLLCPTCLSGGERYFQVNIFTAAETKTGKKLFCPASTWLVCPSWHQWADLDKICSHWENFNFTLERCPISHTSAENSGRKKILAAEKNFYQFSISRIVFETIFKTAWEKNLVSDHPGVTWLLNDA